MTVGFTTSWRSLSNKMRVSFHFNDFSVSVVSRTIISACPFNEMIESQVERWVHRHVKSSAMMSNLESLYHIPSLAKLLSQREPTCVQGSTENTTDTRGGETYIICKSVHWFRWTTDCFHIVIWPVFGFQISELYVVRVGIENEGFPSTVDSYEIIMSEMERQYTFNKQSHLLQRLVHPMDQQERKSRQLPLWSPSWLQSLRENQLFTSVQRSCLLPLLERSWTDPL